jgi:multidrug efflux pump
MARFFIDRPVFAWVISILLMGIGILAIRLLPVAQYPQIAPPSVTIAANYPGASANTSGHHGREILGRLPDGDWPDLDR